MDPDIHIGNIAISNGKIYPLELVQTYPILKLPKSDKYTIIMVDPDAPSMQNPIYKYWLHWLVINNGQEVMSYMPPTPGKGSGVHRYFFLIYKQDYPLYNVSVTNRKNFNLNQFIRDNKLKLVYQIYFKTENK